MIYAFRICIVLGWVFFQYDLHAQEETYYFSPQYSLPGNANNLPGNRVEPPQSRFQQFKLKESTPDFHGLTSTESINQFLKDSLKGPFILEFAIVHHFNKPAGLVLYFEDQKNHGFSFNYFSQKDNCPAEVSLYDPSTKRFDVQKMASDTYQRYWHHFILKVDENSKTIFHNGTRFGEVKNNESLENYDLKVAAYLEKEPHSQLGNLLNYATVYRKDLEHTQPNELFENFKNDLENGFIYSNIFHFNAGPYLHFSTQSSINLIWETNLPSEAVIEYGEELPLTNKLMVSRNLQEPPFIYEVVINGLEPDETYFYNLKLKSVDGNKMESGVLSFKTAAKDENPILFGVIGDTETRPHINDKVAKKLWSERPEFVLLLGDLTDGGMEDAKWQWNKEYFTGMTQLFSRIPVFPVPGNGESDLYWYKKYHSLPGNEAYYTFQYGSAEFFMLNSNERKAEFQSGGKQYQWLDSALMNSRAKWKFVALHHAPYSTDENDYGDSYSGKSNLGDPHVKTLIPLFEKHYVDAVFFGHLHSYNRIGPILNNQYDSQNGVWYIQAGGAGGNLEDFAPTRSWFSQKNYSGHHYCTVSLTENELVLKTYNLDGQLIDLLTIEKP